MNISILHIYFDVTMYENCKKYFDRRQQFNCYRDDVTIKTNVLESENMGFKHLKRQTDGDI